LQTEINEIRIKELTLWAFLCTVFMALQDIAVDGWVVTLLSDEYLSYGPMTQSVGLILGRLMAHNIFIPLNSVKYCNENIFSTPREVFFLMC